MRLASTTLAGAGAAPIIGDALRSIVDWVDACIVICTSDDLADIAAVVEAAHAVVGDKLVSASWPWQSDFAAARNYALDLGGEEGPAWLVTLDCDERIVVAPGFDVRSFLDASTKGAYLCQDGARTYAKQRFIRVPCKTRWICRTHEAFPTHELGQEHLPRVTFDELEKTPAQLRAKFERDARILREDIDRDPKDPRYHYYLGASLHGLGDLPGAIDAFRSCARLRGWPEESAWACYRAAELLVQLGRHDEAVDACSAGLSRHAGIAELCWLAGVASYRAGRADQAAYWAKLAEVHGERGDGLALRSRLGFRAPVGLREGPPDILRFALRAIGDPAGADAAAAIHAQMTGSAR
jgi:tetratricopeptide (TPR) repeat protein